MTHPDRPHDGPERRKRDLWGQLCNPRGTSAGVARGAMIVCAAVLAAVGSAATWLAPKVWNKGVEVIETVDRIDRTLSAFIQLQQWQTDALKIDIIVVKQDNREQGDKLGDHERRIYRIEGRSR